jgi:regulator of RNase E activity RraA
VSSASLSTLLFKRGLRNTCLHGVRRVSSAKANMVGEAFTLRNIPSREDLDQVSVFQSREHPQRKAYDNVPAGHVLVIDLPRRYSRRVRRRHPDHTSEDARRRRSGVDGCLRDIDEIGADGPAGVLRRARPRRSILRAIIRWTSTCRSACGGVAVYPGDIVVGDADGVVIVPRHLAAELAAEGMEMEKFERFVMLEIQRGQPVIGTYPPSAEARARYEEWAKKNN